MTSFQWRQVDYPSGTGYVQTGGAYHESIEQFITEKLGGWSFEGSVFKATTAEIEDYYDCGKVEGDVTKPLKGKVDDMCRIRAGGMTPGQSFNNW